MPDPDPLRRPRSIRAAGAGLVLVLLAVPASALPSVGVFPWGVTNVIFDDASGEVVCWTPHGSLRFEVSVQLDTLEVGWGTQCDSGQRLWTPGTIDCRSDPDGFSCTDAETDFWLAWQGDDIFVTYDAGPGLTGSLTT